MRLRIRILREDNGLYQRNLAEYLKCTQQTYSRYETGELEPSLAVMERLARFYDTSIDYLMGLTDIKENNWSRSCFIDSDAVETAELREIIMNSPVIKKSRKPKKNI